MHKRRLRALAALISCILLLSPCFAGGSAAASDSEILLPEPPAAEIRQIFGEQLPERDCEVHLFYPSESGAMLGSVAQTFRARSRTDLMRNVFDALFSPGAYRYASRAGVGDIRLESIEYSRGIAVLNLSIEASVHQSQQDYLSMCAAIVNTYLDIDGVDAVNILISDRSDPMYSMPIGVYTEPIDSITNAVAKLQTEQSHFIGTHGDPISRTAVLYFPANGQSYFVPELRTIRFAQSEPISALIQAITAGTRNAPCAVSPIAEGMQPIVEAPSITVTEDGQRIAEIALSDTTINYLALSGYEPWQLYGAIVLSVTGFVPEIDGVRFALPNAPVDRIQIGSRSISFENAIMRRDDFSDRIGGCAQMIFADENGDLQQRECALSQEAALSPLRTLQAMIDLPNRQDDLRGVFPPTVEAADVLGISIADGIAAVNLSANFYAACQSASAAQERRIAYAVVNAVCAFEGVYAVQILIEGRAVETLAHSIYLKQPLIRDPGMLYTDLLSADAP